MENVLGTGIQCTLYQAHVGVSDSDNRRRSRGGYTGDSLVHVVIANIAVLAVDQDELESSVSPSQRVMGER